ncbi:MAG: hypothetical protein A2077_01395 [Nitrospirae bacterium GWC2_46_6]|nr:MAG: hypothetical protein A2077_01395 [Nitrospirae bacterium GWC2_46_6]OGW23057.1 MAG: hypothetical protein A2X55_08775 [Nitrospirae bacterium GWB2_47_37]HAK87604.1 hypothetical protein [Nitrospiraceae bacterium]HCL81347.1 hypothetical protein [Nitrospiraceae bacterium]
MPSPLRSHAYLKIGQGNCEMIKQASVGGVNPAALTSLNFMFYVCRINHLWKSIIAIRENVKRKIN